MKNNDAIFAADVEAIITVGERIIQKHIAMGNASPLKNMLIADLNAKITAARQKHDEGDKYKRLMEDAWRDRDYFLGVKEKNVQYTLKAIANILESEKTDLSEWGFSK